MAELPLRKRIYYGMGGLTMVLPDLIFMQWLLVRYLPPNSEDLMPAAWFGTIILIGRVVEGFACIVIAHVSDECRSRWGRRIPFMRFSIVPFALVFFFLFMPPAPQMSVWNAVYLLVLVQAYLVLYGLIITPYLALLPEITSDLKERIDLTTFQSVFLLAGNLLFALLGVVLAVCGWTLVAAGVAVLSVVFFIPVSTAIRERHRPGGHVHERLHLFRSIAMTLRNRPFRYLALSMGFYWFGLNGILVLVPNWAVCVLGRGESTVTALMAPFLAVNLLFFFVMNVLAPRVGKYRLMLLTYFGSAAVMAAFALVGLLPGTSGFVQTLIAVAFFGCPAAGFMVLPFAVMSDVADYDEQKTDRRREAIFFGVSGIFQKVMIGLSVLTFTYVAYIGNDGSRTLVQDGWVTFTGVYTAAGEGAEWPAPPKASAPLPMEPGTIAVQPSPAGIEAPWTLRGPDGIVQKGVGKGRLSDMPQGAYRLVWGNVAGWQSPEPLRAPTTFGLKLMAVLCAVSALLAGFAFLGYELRERDGKVYLVGDSQALDA